MCFGALRNPEKPTLPIPIEKDKWVGYCSRHGYFINTIRGYTGYFSGHLYVFSNGMYLDCPKCEKIKYGEMRKP